MVFPMRSPQRNDGAPSSRHVAIVLEGLQFQVARRDDHIQFLASIFSSIYGSTQQLIDHRTTGQLRGQ